jgi:hypothetical protein
MTVVPGFGKPAVVIEVLAEGCRRTIRLPLRLRVAGQDPLPDPEEYNPEWM